MLEWYPPKHQINLVTYLYISSRNAKRIRRSHTLALVVLAKLTLPARYAHAVRVSKTTDAGKEFGRSGL
jgi:hypothetical protein